MNFIGFACISVDVSEFCWISLELLGFWWFLVDSSEFDWICLDLVGFGLELAGFCGF